MRGQSTIQGERRGPVSETKMREGVMTEQDEKAADLKTGGGKRGLDMRMAGAMTGQDTMEGRRGLDSATQETNEMKGSLGVETEIVKVIGALAWKGVEE